MESERTQGFARALAEEEVFQPWRRKATYAALLAVLAGLLAVIWYVESNQVLNSEIALGIDPDRAVKFVSIAIAAATLITTLVALRARQFLLATGELRLSGSTLIVSTGRSSVIHESSELRQIRCHASGACIRLLFPDGAVSLPGLWLPPDWKPTWRGWRTPGNSVVRLSRKTHPLLAALRTRRPDLKPRLGVRLAGIVGVELLTGVLGVFGVTIGNYPLEVETRRAADRKRVDEVAIKAFQEGRYLEVCQNDRRSLPDLKHDLYGSMRVADSLLHCGDRKGALEAALGYGVQPFWPVAMDPEVLARIRISSGSYAQAEQLLRGRPGLLLYVALADQGRRTEAEQILEYLANQKGMAQVLSLRHKGRPTEAREAAEALCAASNRRRPWAPSGLVHIFESCMLGRGISGLAEDPRFEPANRELPGIRAELIQFTRREAPELEVDLRSVMRLGENGREIPR